MADLEVRYESAHKQREIEIKELQLAQQETVQLALAVAAILLAALAFVYHGRYRAKQRSADLLEALSRTDPLTGLNNRRAMTESLARNRNLNQRDGRPFSVLLLDVDRFKGFNDQHGHEGGDRVLVELSNCLKAVIRGGDEVARWGGEEFLVLAPETRLQEAQLLAQRITEAIRRLAVDYQGDVLTVTATIGLAEFRNNETIESCIQRADAALLRGKGEGRDRFVSA
jgi:diguanylate cyclase (GGDEF)-like protein